VDDEKEAALEAKTAAGMVSAAKLRIENLSVDDVASELAAGATLLVDIREPEERASTGTIPGAIHAARGMLEFYADATSPYHRPEFETDRRVILHCASGGRSALATDMLRQLGYTRAAHLDGGFKAWSAAGQPVESA
jgi:rhodanese-related sulfurtransferase